MHQEVIRCLTGLSALALCAGVLVCSAGEPPVAPKQGIAVAIVYDTSGSMRETVRNASGKPTAKYVVANAALKAVAAQLEKFVTSQPTNAALPLYAGLFVFDQNSAREAVKLGPFNRAAFDNFADQFTDPSGSTPLGNALLKAGQAVLSSPGNRRHVLVITDGMNTAGPEPSATLPRLQKQAAGQQGSIAVHFVAFDVNERVFAPVKKQGATLVSAADEKQLNAQLDFILQKKILLEDEEN